MRIHVAEFLGTFGLVFFGCGAIANGLGPTSVAVAFGLTIAVAIYALGHISGAHFNPAVSIGFAVGRHFPWSRVATYALAQVSGAVSGAAALRLTLGDVGLGVTQPALPLASALAWEIMMTALLMLVVTAVATDARAFGQGAALAIGGTVALAALVGGPVTGASLNPARSIGPAVVAGDFSNLGLYLAGPITGSFLGALVYRYLRAGPAAPPAGASPRG